MALPETIPVKISSEAAGYLSMTPVERREMPLLGLVEQILGVTGKQAPRVEEILRRGSFVTTSARYRWAPLETETQEVARLLNRFPDPRPDRPFNAAKCRLVILRSQRGLLELPYELASQRRLFKRQSYWDVLVSTLEAESPDYQRYSYSERADVYATRLSLQAVRRLQDQGPLLKYSGFAQQLRYMELESAEIFVQR